VPAKVTPQRRQTRRRFRTGAATASTGRAQGAATAERLRTPPDQVFVALLRGLNVGGNNMVSMKALKASVERLGLENVATYINSGNVLFTTARSDARTLEREIDEMMRGEYGIATRTVVRSHGEMARLVKSIRATWTPDASWRYNVMFLRHEIDSERVVDAFVAKPDIEQVVYCAGTLLWCARADALTRSAMVKVASHPLYKNMTVRNINTTTRLFALMEQMRNASAAG
jgi:uncharacterized protein (DUF1697 family)